MHRSIIPFILVCLGFTVIMLAQDMPLFDWTINDVADNPANFQITPSPLTTRLGESVLLVCRLGGFDSVARLSQNDELLEQISITFDETVFPWLWSLSWVFLFLSGIYVWWFAIRYKYPISKAVSFTALITVMFCWLLINVWHPLSARVAIIFPCPSRFNATLSKVHYEMLVVFLIGICLELGAIGVSLRQIRRAIMQRKESAQSAVG